MPSTSTLFCRRHTVSAVTRATVCLCALLGTLTSLAQKAPLSTNQIWMAVADQKLDTLRGGFSLGDGLNGLMVSFGISRAVYINGALITETTLNVGRVADLTPVQAIQLNQKLQSLSLVQNGPGNTFVPGPVSTTSTASTTTTTTSSPGPTVTAIAGSTMGTLIQNSLNDQQIRYETIVNASSNGLGMVRSLNLQSTLADAIQQSIGQR